MGEKWWAIKSTEEPDDGEPGWLEIEVRGVGTMMLFSDGGHDWQPRPEADREPNAVDDNGNPIKLSISDRPEVEKP